METLVASRSSSSNESDSSDDGASSVGESLELPFNDDMKSMDQIINADNSQQVNVTNTV